MYIYALRTACKMNVLLVFFFISDTLDEINIIANDSYNTRMNPVQWRKTLEP